MRNPEKDAINEARRRRSILNAAYSLYINNTIEAVPMADISAKANVGALTLYNYYNTKGELTIAVAVDQIKILVGLMEEKRPEESIPQYSAAERLVFFLDLIILMYHRRPDILCFVANFESFLKHETFDSALLDPFYEVMEPIARRIHWMYEKAKEDGTVRTDVPEQAILINGLHTMLDCAVKCANGVIWPKDIEINLDDSLTFQRKNLLNIYLTEKGKEVLQQKELF